MTNYNFQIIINLPSAWSELTCWSSDR